MPEAIALPLVILLGITSILLINILDWRVRIGLIAIQYFGVFILVSQSWPVAMAVTKLIAGWIAGAILGMALVSKPLTANPPQKPNPSPTRFSPYLTALRIHPAAIFYFLAALLVGIFVISISPILKSWIPGLTYEQIWAGLLLIGMGTLQLGFRVDPFSTILGLLTISSGLEIIYAAVERSILVAGLLAASTLGLALAGAYLILSPTIEENE